jgi:hypothetical protein
MHFEQTSRWGNGPAFYKSETFESRLRQVRQDAEESWLPGQALGEILSYLRRVEHFTNSGLTMLCVQRRMRWLTAVLQAAARRSQAIGLDREMLNGIFNALAEHDSLLSSEGTVSGPSTKAARDVIRLEIAYLEFGKQER